MAKLKYLCLLILLMVQAAVRAQDSTYRVHYIIVDSTSQSNPPALITAFPTKDSATAYLTGLPALLLVKGFISASIDNISLDSTQAQVQLFLGQMYKWARLRTQPED